MPFEFLTDDHLARYGRYSGEPTVRQLQDYFLLTQPQIDQIADLRHPYTKLGFALQLRTLQFLGTFLIDPVDVPDSVLRTLAVQLGLPKSTELPRYLDRRDTHFEHQAVIRTLLGYKDFDRVEVLHLLRFLYARLLISDERPIVLFDLLTAELVKRRVVLPGPTILGRIVIRTRARLATRLYRQLASRLTDAQVQALEALLVVPEHHRKSPLDVLRTPPTRQTAGGLLHALGRIASIRALEVHQIPLNDLPQTRLQALSRHGLTAWTSHLSQMAAVRRHATLLAVVQHLERSATDDVLDIFDAVMTSLGLRGERLRRKARLRTLKDLDASALLLRDALQMLLDPAMPAPTVRDSILAHFGEASLTQAIASVTELASETDDEVPAAWLLATSTVSRVLSTLLDTITFEGTAVAASTLAALHFLRGTDGKRRHWNTAPIAFIPASWEGTVRPDGTIDQRAYRVCAAYRLHLLLKRREIFVPLCWRYSDPRAQLLAGAAWERLRPDLTRSLGWSTDPNAELDRLSAQLDQAHRQAADSLQANPRVRLEQQDGQATLVITPLEALPLPESLMLLQTQVDARLPEIDLSELLLEVHAFTGFAQDFENVSEGPTRISDFAVSLCAVLVAGACNLDLKSVAQPTHPALTLSRLNWVQQQYLRADTLTQANTTLVNAQAALPLTAVWGDGGIASADGLRFLTPLRNTVATPNSHYFATGRGVTYYVLSSDQYTGLHGTVIPGTLRDSLYILAGLLEQQTVLQPREVMSDTAGYSDVVFGLFHLLGYQFSPRLTDLGNTRYWRINRHPDHGDLNQVARHQINIGLIATHWDDLLRVAGSLHQGSVRAPDIMRVLGRSGSLSGLGKAVAELGRIGKTLYLLSTGRALPSTYSAATEPGRRPLGLIANGVSR